MLKRSNPTEVTITVARQHRFSSKAQWRWAFATKQRFARKWAHRNQRRAPFKTLPRRRAARRS